MKPDEFKPSWDIAPAWATHMMRHVDDDIYSWAEMIGEVYLSGDREPNGKRSAFNIHRRGWQPFEERPAVPASAEPARCGQCHFAGPVEMRMCLCRRHAPAGTRNPPHVLDIRSGCLASSAPAFPIMAAERDWCGDFQPAAATEGAQA